ncbi:MAG: hypothetical protein LBQ52_03025 [Helicobacteraceae bacterium]|nr:hypothetical protein [Helicobacteraceae bacterium]
MKRLSCSFTSCIALFSIDALELNADDLQERAKQHPLFLLIGELKMGKG